MSIVEKKYKTVVTGYLENKHVRELENYCQIERAGWIKTGKIMPEDQLIDRLDEAEIAIISYEGLSSKVMDQCKNLKIIACCRSNPVNIDIAAATQRGIPVIYTPGRNANAVAEFTLGLMLSVARLIPQAHHSLKQGRFLGEPFKEYDSDLTKADVVWNDEVDDPHKIFKGFELRGKTLGIIGLGNIGERVARLAQAFGMVIAGYDPFCSRGKAQLSGVTLMTLEELLRSSDYISLHCKVTKENLGLIGAEQIEMMKPTAALINTARAAMIQEQPLVQALQEKRIRGAALDVFWEEPLPAHHPLLELDNVILTPHLGGASQDVNFIQSGMITEGLMALFKNQIPNNIANPQVYKEER